MRITAILLAIALSAALSCNKKGVSSDSGKTTKTPLAIQWVKFEDLAAAQAKEPRKVFIDVYTDWCGWCKKMDANSFTHPIIIKYMSQKYYAVKFNAETKDTILFNGHKYVNANPMAARGTHQLAMSLLGNKLSYPTTVYLDEELKMLGPIPGYLDPKMMESVLHYYGDDAHKTTPWPTYQSTFFGEIQ